MIRNYFSNADIKKLSKSKYVRKISSANIMFTDEFKVIFMEELNKGRGPSEILDSLGIDYTLLGRDRIDSLANRYRENSKRPEGLKRKKKTSN